MCLEVNNLLLFGGILVLGLAAARIMDKISIPHVVGFILLGVILGDSIVGFCSIEKTTQLNIICDLALGFIGFGMGEHLLLSELKRLGKSIVLISLLESLGAFALVYIGVYIFSNSVALSLIFASLASATAPAATVDVLKQYKSKGPLTTTLLAVVGIDDAIALLLFSLAAPFAVSLSSGSSAFGIQEVIVPLFEIFGSILLGFILALPADFVLDRMKKSEEILLFTIASVLVVVGLSVSLGISSILSTLVFGATTINLKHAHAEYVSKTIDRVGPILYILFFVLVGARLDVKQMAGVGVLAVAYLLFRAFGKVGGAYLGAKISGASVAVQKYLGLTLLSQAGVAVGLALSIASTVSGMGEEGKMLERTIITTIITTTLIIQIIGPILTKHAIFAAGEAKDKEGTFFG